MKSVNQSATFCRCIRYSWTGVCVGIVIFVLNVRPVTAQQDLSSATSSDNPPPPSTHNSVVNPEATTDLTEQESPAERSETSAKNDGDLDSDATKTPNESTGEGKDSQPSDLHMAAQFFLGVPVGFLSDTIQEEGGLASSGWGICLGLAFQVWWFNLTLDFGFEHYDDDQAFRQSVVDNFGNQSVAESRVNLSYFAPSIGVKTPVFTLVDQIFAIDAGMNIGYSIPFDTDRQIENCEDCHTEEIDVKGGMFIEPQVEFLWPGMTDALFGLSVSWQYYLGDSDYDYRLSFRGVITLLI